MTPRNITSAVDRLASPVSFFPVTGSIPRDNRLTNGSRRPAGSYVNGSAAGAGAAAPGAAGCAVPGCAGCAAAGCAGCTAGAPCAGTTATLAATSAAAITNVFIDVVFNFLLSTFHFPLFTFHFPLVRLRRRFRGLQQHEGRRHAIDADRRSGLRLLLRANGNIADVDDSRELADAIEEH